MIPLLAVSFEQEPGTQIIIAQVRAQYTDNMTTVKARAPLSTVTNSGKYFLFQSRVNSCIVKNNQTTSEADITVEEFLNRECEQIIAV